MKYRTEDHPSLSYWMQEAPPNWANLDQIAYFRINKETYQQFIWQGRFLWCKIQIKLRYIALLTPWYNFASFGGQQICFLWNFSLCCSSIKARRWWSIKLNCMEKQLCDAAHCPGSLYQTVFTALCMCVKMWSTGGCTVVQLQPICPEQIATF